MSNRDEEFLRTVPLHIDLQSQFQSDKPTNLTDNLTFLEINEFNRDQDKKDRETRKTELQDIEKRAKIQFKKWEKVEVEKGGY